MKQSAVFVSFLILSGIVETQLGQVTHFITLFVSIGKKVKNRLGNMRVIGIIKNMVKWQAVY